MSIAECRIHRFETGSWEELSDVVVQECPLAIYVDGRHLQTVYCLPADLELLLLGYLFHARVITDTKDIETLLIDPEKNEAHVKLRASIIKQEHPPIPSLPVEPLILPETILKLAEELANNQLFRKTGAVHCGLIAEGRKVLFTVEDTGRFNVLDKITGFIVREKLNPSNLILSFSGRLTCGVMERVARSGMRVIVSPAAPTLKGLEIAIAEGVTAIGFARGERFNLYTHPERIVRELSSQ